MRGGIKFWRRVAKPRQGDLKQWPGLPYMLLGVFVLVLLFLPMGAGNLYGSDGDWLSQHVAIAESLRQSMLSTHSILPQWIGLGGGSGIYDFAYYGVLRPDVLLSCLIPGVPMKYVISIYAMFGVMASGMLCHKWLSKVGKDKWTSFFGAVLLLSSTCFYQAHHQIIFVNYMPFLILALMGCDRLLEKGRIGMMCVSVFLMIVHSFYYSPTGIVVIGIYGIWRVVHAEGGKWAAALRKIFLLGAAVLLAVGMGMILLLPTGMDILSTSKDAGNFARESIPLLDMEMGGLLYSPYGCGMTILTLFCLVLSLGNRKRRWLSICLLVAMAVPAVSLVLNGFLYARGKILIPFVPLLVLVCIDTLGELWERKVRLKKGAFALCLLACLIPAWDSEWRPVILAEAALITVWAAWWMWGEWFAAGAGMDEKGRGLIEPVMDEKGRGRRTTGRRYKFWVILLFPVWVSLIVNLRSSALEDLFDKLNVSKRENYLSVEDERQEHVAREQVADFANDADYRMEYLANAFMNSNMLCDGESQRVSIYSSISNKTYARFFYDTMGNAISYNNRVALVAGKNPLFNEFMGVRYLVCKSDNVPAGWDVQETYGEYVLAENDGVRPICYGSTELMDEEEFEEISFPWTLAALSCHTVVETVDGEKSGMMETESAGGEDYAAALATAGGEKSVAADGGVTQVYPKEFFVKEDLERLLSHEMSKDNFELNLARPLSDKILAIRFHVEREDGKEVKIYINNMSNKLSAKSAPYPNGNEDFVYVFDPGDGAECLQVRMSEGKYKVRDLEVFCLDRDILNQKHIIMPEDARGGEKDGFSLARMLWIPQGGTKVCQKSIDMPKDGYFVTSYPFRKGYRVWVDGREVEPEKVNTAFVGVPLTKGRHEVAIIFQSPGFVAGATVSAACWLGLFIVFVMDLGRRKTRRGRMGGEEAKNGNKK